MGRKNMAIVRRPQIYAAAARMIAEHGLAGATQDRIAEAAGLSRSHVRHYVGNREEMLAEVWRLTIEPHEAGIAAAARSAAEEATLDPLLEQLFGPVMRRTQESVVIAAFRDSTLNDTELRAQVDASYGSIAQTIATALSAVAPHLPAETIGEVAYTWMCLGVGNSALEDVPFDAASSATARRGALALWEATNVRHAAR